MHLLRSPPGPTAAALLALALAANCGEAQDAPSGTDATAAADTGPSDAAPPPSADVGGEADGSAEIPDASPSADAGDAPDGSAEADAGPLLDAGGGADGSADSRDAGAGDASGEGDAGLSVPCALPPVPLDALDVTAAPFFAQGDGATDDTAALQAAIDAAPPGGTVYIPDGTYLVQVASGSDATGLALKSDLTLRLGERAVLQALPTSSETYSLLRLYQVSNVAVWGGTLLGERAAHTGTGGEFGYGVDIQSSSGITIGQVTSSEMWGDGFYVGNTPGGGNPADVTLCACRADHNRRQGLSIVASDGVLVDGCVFSNTSGTAPEAGIDLEPNGGGDVGHVRIQNCELLGNLAGLLVSGSPSAAAQPHGCTLSGNHLHDNREDGLFLNQGDGDNVLSDNLVEHNARHGIVVRAKHFTLERNTVRANASHGITAFSVHDQVNGEAMDLVLDGNVVSENGFSGISLAYSHQNRVTSNECRANAWSGLALSLSSANTVSGNLLVANSQAADDAYANLLVADGSSDNAIDGNTAQLGTLANRPRYGILVRDASCTANAVTNNVLTDSGATASFRDDGTGTVAQGNQL